MRAACCLLLALAACDLVLGLDDLPADRECVPQSTVACYTGPADTLAADGCRAGERTCLPDGSGFGECVGEIVPDASSGACVGVGGGASGGGGSGGAGMGGAGGESTSSGGGDGGGCDDAVARFGSGDFLQLEPGAPQLLATTDYSLEAWISPSELPAGGGRATIVTRAATAQDAVLAIVDTGSADAALFFEAGACSLVVTDRVPRGVWTHVAASFSSEEIVRLYVDGALVGTRDCPVPGNIGTYGGTWIGSPAAGVPGLVGLIDDVVLRDYAVTLPFSPDADPACDGVLAATGMEPSATEVESACWISGEWRKAGTDGRSSAVTLETLSRDCQR